MTTDNNKTQLSATANILDVNSLATLKRQAGKGDPAANKEVARQFEAFFLQMVMKSMRDATPRQGPFDSDQTRLYESLLDQQHAQVLGGGSRGTGLAAMIEAQLARQNQAPRPLAGPLPLQPAARAFSLPQENALPLPLRRDVAPAIVPLKNLPATAVPPAPTSAPGAATTLHKVVAGDTLGKIAARTRPEGVSHDQMLVSLFRSNKDVFVAGNMNRLKAGTILSIPDAKAASQISAGEARREVLAQAADFNAYPNRLASVAAAAEPARAFVDRMLPVALAAEQITGIPAHFMVAQAALETGWGKSEPRRADGSPSFNSFGIKAGANWRGATVDATTTEVIAGLAQTRIERFRAYASYEEAFGDYANLLVSNPRYAAILGAQEPGRFARGLQAAGFATDPQYAAKLQSIIGGTTLRQALAV
jgi:flagellar protein FlgJ